MKDMESKKRFWQSLVQVQAKSGLSQKKFCEQNEVRLSTFTVWKTKLRKQLKPKDNAKFISLVPVEEKEFSIFTPSGFELKFAKIPHPQWLKEFLESSK